MFTERIRFARMNFITCLALSLLFGCAVRQKGLIFVVDEQAYLESVQRDRWLLRPNPDVYGLTKLDGHLLEIHGTRSGTVIRVEKYTVLEGTHGLAHWVGVITRRQGQWGLIDVEGSQFRPLVGNDLSALYQRNGALVLVEGYIERAGEVRVMYYRILEDSGEKP